MTYGAAYHVCKASPPLSSGALTSGFGGLEFLPVAVGTSSVFAGFSTGAPAFAGGGAGFFGGSA